MKLQVPPRRTTTASPGPRGTIPAGGSLTFTVSIDWPEGVPRQYTVEAYAGAFRAVGFEVCEDAVFEDGVEKEAIFADPNGSPTHAARQLNDGTWTSKLGQLEDIRHQNLDQVSEGDYGKPVLVLRRSAA